MQIAGEEHSTQRGGQGSGLRWVRLLRTAGWPVWLEWRRGRGEETKSHEVTESLSIGLIEAC